ncbi:MULTISPECIES: DUF350 domain-containing protein [Alteribacter]|uniref:DUF350 domain-containing protein n=1 Tax=Alteribacter keqinensis TaxID=2483800 RepID=A0A3M7TZU6_9BACI|nr:MULTISPECIES: DUF350 domain-containing protein [Alteribacter]MBM7096518.1 DUF350 domain-containing protein [Alteribacter salitolerans]RNA70274.1 DUF350 domain-containing protein [Alteribacter keqinensis]
METLFEHDFLYTAGIYSVVVMAIVVFLAVFEMVTRYKTWDEIQNGNVAVAMATGGKIFGVANVFRYSVEANDTVFTMLAWGVYGFVLLLFVYFIFEFLTPKFKVDAELKNGNRAVGLISLILSIALSYVIGASIRS